MASELYKKAISRITSEERALMVKSLEIISQIHAILDRRDISQKELAEMLKISQPAVSKILSPGGNLEMNTLVKIEVLLGETIITTPQKEVEILKIKKKEWTVPHSRQDKQPWMEVTYKAPKETIYTKILVN